MASTTLAAIRAALETTLAGISLTDTTPGQRKLRKIPPGKNWNDVSDQQKDRGFMVGVINEQEASVFGLTASTDYKGTVPIKIRHKRDPNEEASLDRMNTDLGQIRETLEKKANFPSGVSLVRLEDFGSPTEESDAFWETEMIFRLVYSRDLP